MGAPDKKSNKYIILSIYSRPLFVASCWGEL
jgi:hypothetical protein